MMSEWIKVRLTGNLCMKLASLMMMALCIILAIITLRAGLSERMLGLCLAGLLLLFLSGYGLFYWAGSRYLLANPATKEIRFRQLLLKDKCFSLKDLSSIIILKYNIRLQFHDTIYSFQYAKENLEWITFLKENSPLWKPALEPVLNDQAAGRFVKEPEPVISRTMHLLISARRMLFVLLLLFCFILLLNLTSPILVIILLCALLLCALFIHVADYLIYSSMYNSVYQNGQMVTGTISRFSGRSGHKTTPHFTFWLKDGQHEVESMIPMTVRHKEEPYWIGKTYQVWYAPKESNLLLYGDKEPEPLPLHYMDLILIIQMAIALFFFLMLFFTSSSAVMLFSLL